MSAMENTLANRLDKAARCLRVLAHPVRLLIIHLLGEGERSVQEVEKLVHASQSRVSQPPGSSGSRLSPESYSVRNEAPVFIGCGLNSSKLGAPGAMNGLRGGIRP